MKSEVLCEAEITPGMVLPDLLRSHPELRAILDRYGLRGCGGPHGPAETIEYFSRVHGVDLPGLLAELNAALSDPSSLAPLPAQSASNPLDELADTIYRRFFKAGLVVILTAGALWGAVLLLRIGVARSFTAISIHEINAHGHAQIFGWVGLFVMGFAYQAFPRMKHTNLWRPDLANMTFYLMVFGVFARAIGEPFFEWPFLRELAVSAGMAELAAIGLFIAILLKTFKGSGKPYEIHDAYILAALAFFFVQAIYDLGLLYATTSTNSQAALLGIIATYQAPLRDLQIHGFAMLMILGVAIRMFPALFGLAAPGPKLVRRSLPLLIAGVLAEAVCFALMRQTGNHVWGVGMYLGVLLVAGTSVALTFRWGLLAKPTEQDRSIKFVRTAVGWLHTSMLMLVLIPLYAQVILPSVSALSAGGQHAVDIGFSHAYYGAVRHAITVGFISLTILGMAAKVVPTLAGLDVRRLSSLWPPFVLVNLGCFLRVAFQIGTDFHFTSFPVAAVSGLLEVSGIAVWGVQLWRIMNGWQPTAEGATGRPAAITAEDKIGQIVEWFPETLTLLIDKGFAPLGNPVLRRTVARTISVRTAAAHHGIELQPLLRELNQAAYCSGRQADGPPVLGGRGVSLPVIQAG